MVYWYVLKVRQLVRLLFCSMLHMLAAHTYVSCWMCTLTIWQQNSFGWRQYSGALVQVESMHLLAPVGRPGRCPRSKCRRRGGLKPLTEQLHGGPHDEARHFGSSHSRCRRLLPTHKAAVWKRDLESVFPRCTPNSSRLASSRLVNCRLVLWPGLAFLLSAYRQSD